MSLGSTLAVMRKSRESFSKHGRRPTPTGTMTPREIQFLDCLISGLSYKEIAAAFGRKPRTISEMIRHACDRTDNRTPEQLAAWWAVKKALAMQNRSNVA